MLLQQILQLILVLDVVDEGDLPTLVVLVVGLADDVLQMLPPHHLRAVHLSRQQNPLLL